MATINPTKHLTTLNEWHKMGEANIFPYESRLELINGEILDMAPIGFNHSGHLKRLNNLFNKIIGDHAVVSVQDPLQLSDLSEPEPDFMLLRPNTDFYTTRHPQADDVLLLVEVSDSTLRFDRNQKLRLYASHSILEYWIINLLDNCVEIYRQPHGDEYAQKNTLLTGDSVTLTSLPHITIQLSDIL